MQGDTDLPAFGDYMLLALLGYLWGMLLLAALVSAAALAVRSRIIASGAGCLAAGMLAYYCMPLPVQYRDYFQCTGFTPLLWCWPLVLMCAAVANVRAWRPRKTLKPANPSAT